MAMAMKGKHHPASADADFLRNARMHARVRRGRVAFEPLVRLCAVLRFWPVSPVILTCLQVYLSCPHRSACARVSERPLVPGPFWSPMRGSMPLADRPDVTDTFAGLLNLFASPRSFLHTFGVERVFTWLSSLPDSSACCVALQLGESGDSGPVLMTSCVYAAVFACTAMSCVSMRMFGVPAQLLGLAWLFVGRLSGLIGELCGFVVF